MSKHRDYIEIPLEATDLREVVHGPVSGYVIEANDVDTLVEIWVSPERLFSEAVANLRLQPEDAKALAEQLLMAAERIERDLA